MSRLLCLMLLSLCSSCAAPSQWRCMAEPEVGLSEKRSLDVYGFTLKCQRSW